MDVWIYNLNGIRFRVSPTPISDRDIPGFHKESMEEFPWLVYHKMVRECNWICSKIPDGTIGKLEL